MIPVHLARRLGPPVIKRCCALDLQLLSLAPRTLHRPPFLSVQHRRYQYTTKMTMSVGDSNGNGNGSTAVPVIPAKQKAAIYDQPGTVSTKVVEIDVPEPGVGEVLINLYVSPLARTGWT